MSLPQLNAWIAETYPGLNVALYKGEGYFYWIDANDDADSDVYNQIGFEFESIYVCHFSQATMDWWQAQAKCQIDAYLGEKNAHAAGTTAAAAAGPFPILEDA